MNADFLNTRPAPVPVAHLPEIDTSGAARCFNRELSWLAFNWRVLEEAANPNQPLLERLRFLSISGSNLDEFYTVRVAGLRAQVRSAVDTRSIDGRTPAQQLEKIDADCLALIRAQNAAWDSLKREMEAEKIHVVEAGEVTAEDRAWLDQHFMDQVFPVLTPIAIDPAHPFPFIPNTGIALVLELARKSDGKALEALLPIPGQLDRFLRLGEGEDGAVRFLPLETLIELSLDQLFFGYEVQHRALFRILRDSDLEVEEEAEDLVREFETALKRRRRGEVIRLKISASAPEALKKMIADALGVARSEVIEVPGIVGVADLAELVIDDFPALRWIAHQPRMPERVRDHNGDIFAAVRQKDMLLHHPYESFDIVVNFIQQAARDPDVAGDQADALPDFE